jgi:hypothetical protein
MIIKSCFLAALVVKIPPVQGIRLRYYKPKYNHSLITSIRLLSLVDKRTIQRYTLN